MTFDATNFQISAVTIGPDKFTINFWQEQLRPAFPEMR